MADCRRLDEYLETYCKGESCQNEFMGNTARPVSVAAALAIRDSVHVEGAEENQSRAQSLQNAAATALAGLFVYGNDRGSRHPRQSRHQSRQPVETVPPSRATRTPETLSATDLLVRDWGFDLSRTVEDSSTFGGGSGWVVIDDDEAAVVASRRGAYLAVQAAFPRLVPASSVPSTENGAVHAQLEYNVLERVRELSLQEETANANAHRQLLMARERRMQEALDRREERRRINEKKREEQASQWEKRKHEEEEMQRARDEIDTWREEYWRRLRTQAEMLAPRTSAKTSRTVEDIVTELPGNNTDRSQPMDDTEEDVLAQKKAKAASKRKRAKERRKARKAEEIVQHEAEVARKTILAKKEASSIRCAACGEGILDCGFEKFGRKFCSTTCARTAKPNRQPA